MNLEISSSPTDLPLTLDEVKAHLRIVDNFDDDYLSALILVAVDRFTAITLRSCMVAGYVATFDGFKNPLRLERSPVVNVVSLQYMDKNSVWNTIPATEYEVRIFDDECLIVPVEGGVWSYDLRDSSDNVMVEYTAGYTELPEQAKQWMKIVIADMYENRNPSTPLSVNSIDYVDHLLDSLILPWEFK